MTTHSLFQHVVYLPSSFNLDINVISWFTPLASTHRHGGLAIWRIVVEPWRVQKHWDKKTKHCPESMIVWVWTGSKVLSERPCWSLMTIMIHNLTHYCAPTLSGASVNPYNSCSFSVLTWKNYTDIIKNQRPRLKNKVLKTADPQMTMNNHWFQEQSIPIDPHIKLYSTNKHVYSLAPKTFFALLLKSSCMTTAYA